MGRPTAGIGPGLLWLVVWARLPLPGGGGR